MWWLDTKWLQLRALLLLTSIDDSLTLWVTPLAFLQTNINKTLREVQPFFMLISFAHPWCFLAFLYLSCTVVSSYFDSRSYHARNVQCSTIGKKMQLSVSWCKKFWSWCHCYSYVRFTPGLPLPCKPMWNFTVNCTTCYISLLNKRKQKSFWYQYGNETI